MQHKLKQWIRKSILISKKDEFLKQERGKWIFISKQIHKIDKIEIKNRLIYNHIYYPRQKKTFSEKVFLRSKILTYFKSKEKTHSTLRGTVGPNLKIKRVEKDLKRGFWMKG